MADPTQKAGGANLSNVLDDAASRAAGLWAVDVSNVDLLAVSENAVYRVDTASGDRFVLRLHRPGYNTIDEMRFEQRWVHSLHADGIAVPGPRPSLVGNSYESVPVDDPNSSAPSSSRRWAGAIDWVDGIKLADLIDDRGVDEQLEAVPSLYHAVGALAARIRVHAGEWELPDGFVRRSWDADGLLGPEPLWGRFWEVSALTSAQADLLTTARNQLYDILRSLQTDASRYGLIHADLHQSNVMFATDSAERDRGIAIDFDDAGFGWFIHELGVALQAVIDEPWVATAREALIDGYRSVYPLDDEELGLLDTFCTIRTLMIIGWLDARPELEQHEQLSDYISWACEEAEKYLGVTR
ncbi:MAG: phosphotransferase enzyme family protein [Acidimicrobiales bacterium]